MFKIAVSAAIIFSLVACEEFGPVFTGKYDEPEKEEYQELDVKLTDIKDLIAMYPEPGAGFTIMDDIVIAGKVTTSDQQGNFYKSLYIQDKSAGIEIKIGKNGLYNDYKLGQTLYVKCKGLTLGQYGYRNDPTKPDKMGNGMISLGYSSTKYENDNLDSSKIIDEHIIKGPLGEPVAPYGEKPEELITEELLPQAFDTQVQNHLVGKLVTLKGLKYGNQIFTIINVDPLGQNRLYLSDETWGVTSWSISKFKMDEYLLSGVWDEADLRGGLTVADYKGDGTYPKFYRSNVIFTSQYFKLGEKDIQVHTSGYSKFGDTEIDKDVLSGAATIDLTGILNLYNGQIQLHLVDLNGIHVNRK